MLCGYGDVAVAEEAGRFCGPMRCKSNPNCIHEGEMALNMSQPSRAD